MINKKFKFVFLFLLIILVILLVLNKETTRKIGINYNIIEYKIPVYLKINDFFNRHYNYKYLSNKINKDHFNKEDIILNTAKWVNINIKKIPEGIDVIDHHPLTIVQRRLGVHSQFNDILSVLLVYEDIDSFFKRDFGNISHPLTFFKLNNKWSVIDPYYGVYFINDDKTFASLEDLKTPNWTIVNLESQEINSSNITDLYFEKFQSYKEVEDHYIKIFSNIQSSKQIDATNIFDRGGRSYTQKPLNRLKFEIYKLF